MQLREKLGLNAYMMELPIGLEDKLEGVVDLVGMKAIYFDGPNGEDLRIAVGLDRRPAYRTFARREIIHNDVVHIHFRRKPGRGGAVGLAVEPKCRGVDQEGGKSIACYPKT